MNFAFQVEELGYPTWSTTPPSAWASAGSSTCCPRPCGPGTWPTARPRRIGRRQRQGAAAPRRTNKNRRGLNPGGFLLATVPRARARSYFFLAAVFLAAFFFVAFLATFFLAAFLATFFLAAFLATFFLAAFLATFFLAAFLATFFLAAFLATFFLAAFLATFFLVGFFLASLLGDLLLGRLLLGRLLGGSSRRQDFPLLHTGPRLLRVPASARLPHPWDHRARPPVTDVAFASFGVRLPAEATTLFRPLRKCVNKKREPSATVPSFFWCPGRDSNPHGLWPLPPQDSVSTSFTTRARD